VIPLPAVWLVPLVWIGATAAIAAGPDPAGAPRIVFERELPGDSLRTDIAANVLPLPDGALVTGWTTVAGRPPQGLVVRVDGDANVRWRREPGGAGTDLLFAAQPDGQGGFVCAGFTTGRGKGGSDGWLVRLDSTGATTWERTGGGPGDERLTSLQVTREGWMAAGQMSRAGDTEAWVVHLDRAGRVAGEWTWGGPGVQRGLGLQPLAQGGCIVAGRTGEGRGEADGFVTRLDRDGRPEWTRTVGGPGFQVAYHLRPPRDGSFLVTGYGFVDSLRDHDAFVLRVGADGRIASRTDLGGEGDDRATQSVALEDGATVTIGYLKPAGAADGDPAWQTMLYGLDPLGRFAWSRPVGGLGVESGRWIAGTVGGLWAVAQVSPPAGGSRILVVRLDTSPRTGGVHH
jgi:hypothetical protein